MLFTLLDNLFFAWNYISFAALIPAMKIRLDQLVIGLGKNYLARK